MNTYTARWMRLKTFQKDDVERIHRIERASHELGLKQRAGLVDCHPAKFEYWQFATPSVFDDLTSKYGKVWVPKTPESHKAEEIDRFERTVFSIWAPLQRAHVDGHDDYPHEIDWAHRADWKIFYMPYEIKRRATSASSLPGLGAVKGRQ